VELAGTAVMAGAEVGVGTAGVAGVIPDGVGELASALVGAGVPIGRVTRMLMAVPTVTPIRITHTVGRGRMRQRTRIGLAGGTETRVTTRSSKIRGIWGRRDRVAQTTKCRRRRS
jgi:hypothetical protein